MAKATKGKNVVEFLHVIILLKAVKAVKAAKVRQELE